MCNPYVTYMMCILLVTSTSAFTTTNPTKLSIQKLTMRPSHPSLYRPSWSPLYNAKSGAPEITSAEELTKLLSSETPTLVFYNAPWCGPCRLTAPVVASLLDKYKDSKLTMVEVCTDEHEDICELMKIEEIPTVVVYKSGKALDSSVGSVSETVLYGIVDKILDMD